MLVRTGGNLGGVYLETERQRIARGAEEHINAVVARSNNTDCEISEGASADWYLVHSFPGDDARAMRWLARRRFGVFRPMQQRTDKRNDAKVQGLEPVFPGWLFVYVWDMRKLAGRILACPGVLDILCDPVSLAPIPINQADEAGVLFVDKLQSLSWVYKENAPRLQRHQPVSLSAASKQKIHNAFPQRPTKCQRKTLDRLKKTLKTQGNWDASKWDCANLLEPHQRIALLQRFVHGSAVAGCP